MKISFSPVRTDDVLTLEKTSADRLRINGELFNFGPLNNGDTIPAGAIPCDWIIGPVERIDGAVCLTIKLPHGPSPEPWQAFPDPIIVTQDGPIDIPVDTRVDVQAQPRVGGTMIITTTRRWRQAPEVSQTFVPHPPAPEPDPETATEEADDVDA
jgi:hypothetical protein